MLYKSIHKINVFVVVFYFQIGVLWLILTELVDSIFTDCREPRNLAAQLDKLYEEMLNMTQAGTPTYGILPPYRSNNPAFPTDAPAIKHESLKFRIYGKAKCMRLRVFERRSHLNYKSTCPWYVYLEYDVDRLPQTMTKAECSCKRCFNVFNNGKAGNCQKIESFVPVIRRSCKIFGGTYKYAISMESVPVGCTCT